MWRLFLTPFLIVTAWRFCQCFMLQARNPLYRKEIPLPTNGLLHVGPHLRLSDYNLHIAGAYFHIIGPYIASWFLYDASSLKVMKISNRCCWLYLTGLNFLSSWPSLCFVTVLSTRIPFRASPSTCLSSFISRWWEYWLTFFLRPVILSLGRIIFIFIISPLQL